ncbi:MAG: pentapeptide repeat-containing protein [Acidobacteria bacterium]|nr:pentapeptide repeat-containing protein [Acidobacteriota bacterium]
MANRVHLEILKQGSEVWNRWRKDHPEIGLQDNLPIGGERPDFSGADLRGVQLGYVDEIINLSFADFRRADLRKADLTVANLIGADLSWADLSEANLRDALLDNAQLYSAKLCKANLARADLNRAILTDANLTEANLNKAKLVSAGLFKAQLNLASFYDTDMSNAFLEGAKLIGADLAFANLTGANLMGADLNFANLNQARLSQANLSQADLRRSALIGTYLEAADLTGCKVFGTSIWKVSLSKETIQSNLVITEEDEPAITVDNLEVAQFIYLLLHNDKIRNVIDTIGEKGVLILGRFTKERKAVLDAIRERLRALGFVPMMFDFERPTQRDFTETIKTLAGLSRFIIADITNPKSSPLELQATMPDYMIPFVPIIHEDEEPFAMFKDLKQKYGEWVLDVLKYDSTDNLLQVLDQAVVRPALEMSQKLLLKKAEAIRERHVRDYL